MTTETRFHRAAVVVLTAALIATLSVALTGGDRAGAVEGPVDVVYVATGRNFPDALAGATLAATAGAPMLTVEPDLPLPPTTVAALQSLDPDRIVILGGPVAVGDAVRGALADFARSGSVTRIEGSDRHDTAAQIAEALPDKVHDSNLLDGRDATELGRVDAIRRPGLTTTDLTGQGVVLQRTVSAPRDGFLLLTAQMVMINTSGGDDLIGVLTVDDPGPIDVGNIEDTAAVGLVRPHDTNGGGTLAMTSTVPVTAGDHVIRMHALHGAVSGTMRHGLETLNAVFVPFGDADVTS